MQEVIKYQCDHCHQLFHRATECLEHEALHLKIQRANQMLEEGATLGQIQRECEIWDSFPDYLSDITKSNCFVIGYWQCCDKPAYTITEILMNKRVQLGGCGSWTGYYYNDLKIDDIYFREPHPAEELFVDDRYTGY